MAITTIRRQDGTGTSEVANAHGVHGSATAKGGSTSGRDALLDNAKFLLIVLVVVGHAIEPVSETRLSNALYFWIYLFHMPAFVLISGYLSRSFDGSGRRLDKLLTTVVAPYFLFWGVYTLQAMWTDRQPPDGPLDPLWITWFLAALFVWRLTVPLWSRIRWPFAVSVGISLLGGLVATGDALGISRVLGLLPFFVAGLLLEQRHLDMLRSGWVRACSVGVILVTAATSYLYLEQKSREWVYWRESLVDRNMELLPVGLPGRIVVLILAFSLTAALLSLVPRKTTWFTRFGALTMYVYLLHGLVIRTAEEFGYYELVDQFFGEHGALVVSFALAVALALVLCAPWVRAATRWAVEPRVDWLLRGDRDGSGNPPGTTSEATRRVPAHAR